MNNKKIKIIVSYIFVILWMVVIFMFSSANGELSSSNSTGLINSTISVIDNTLVSIHIKEKPLTKLEKLELIETLNVPIRKLAHFTEYLILCLLWINALNKSNVKHKYLLAILFSIIYAISDEYHQTFISGRSGQLLDVLIDSGGVITGSIINKLLNKIRKKCR